MSVSETRSLTVYELNHRAQGLKRKQEHQWQQTASIMTAILQPHSKKKVRPKDFMPEAFRHLAPKMSPERIREDVKRKVNVYKRAHGDDS